MSSNWLSLNDTTLPTSNNLVGLVNDLKSDVYSSDCEYTPSEINRLHENVLNRSLEVEVEDAFNLFDRNGDGMIDFFECQAAFKALRLNSSVATVKELFKELDKNENDALTLTDFKTLVIAKIHTRYTTSEIEKIFNQLQDGDDADITDEELEMMIKETSGDGNYLTIEDFTRVVKSSWTGDPLDAMFDSDLS